MTRNKGIRTYINTMKRRDFIRNATAMAAVPALPVGALGATPVSAALLARAEHMAGLWVHTSANMMKQAFGLDDAASKALFKSMIENQIVAAPNSFGVAKAVVPCYENPAFVAKVNSLVQKARPISTAPIQDNALDLEDLDEKVAQLIEDHIEDAEHMQEDPS